METPQEFIDRMDGFINSDITSIELSCEIVGMFDDYTYNSDIFNTIPEDQKNFEFIDEVVGMLDVTKYSAQVLVLILCSLINDKGRLNNRRGFVLSTRDKLVEELGETEAFKLTDRHLKNSKS